MRKILLTLAAAATLAGGVAATSAPAEAKVHVYLGIGAPGFYGGPGDYAPGFYDGYGPGFGDGFYDPGYYPSHFRRHHRHYNPVRCYWVKKRHHHHYHQVKRCRPIYY